MKRISSTALISALTAALPACQGQPDFEIRYETEHLQIATEFDEALCAGDLSRWEKTVTTLEDELDTSLREPVEVYVWGLDTWPDGEWCAPSAIGCYERRSQVIYTMTAAIEHELVHAVVGSLGGKPVAFFDEGAATGLEWELVRAGDSEPLANLGLGSLEVDRYTAGHFVRWLYEEWGGEKLGALLASKQGPLTAFEAVYGMSMQSAQALYQEQAPWAYPPLFGCDAPSLDEVAGGAWFEEFEFDCDDPNVIGGTGGRGAVRVLTVDERGQHALSTTAPAMVIMPCVDAPIQDEITLEDFFDTATYGDLPPVHPAYIGSYTRALAGDGELNVLDLIPGRYEIIVGGQLDRFDPQSLTVDRLP